MAALNLYVEEEYVRAAPGGAGGVKSITNYAPVSFETNLVSKFRGKRVLINHICV